MENKDVVQLKKKL